MRIKSAAATAIVSGFVSMPLSEKTRGDHAARRNTGTRGRKLG